MGKLIAKRAKEANIESVAWVRKHGQRYHGKTAALIVAMQSAGLPLK